MDGFIVKDARGEGMLAHPSTQGAVAALNWLQEQEFNPLKIIDIGCGSGILSMIMAQMWPESAIIATDISLQALVDCNANNAANGLSEHIKTVRSKTAADPAIKALAPYNLVIANVLASYHITNSVHYKTLTQGYLALSGIRAWEKEPVMAALVLTGFLFQAEFQQEQWITLIFTKASQIS